MEDYEKEQMLYYAIHNTIEHILMENGLTYFQVIGALDVVKGDYKEDFNSVNIEEEEEE